MVGISDNYLKLSYYHYFSEVLSIPLWSSFISIYIGHFGR
jgi:hypothetical protein